MRSSSGLYVSKLDHVRAFAAFQVYCWHFVRTHVPPEIVPGFAPLSVLEEGHIGVALFMTLSGYLFAKIINGRPLDLRRFYLNRFLRLAPLLGVVLLYWASQGHLGFGRFFQGFIYPKWPKGGWSIAVELHFYALLPAILWLQRQSRVGALAALIVAAILVRFTVWRITGISQNFSYWTIGGCIDLFLGGMLWFELSKLDIVRRHAGAIFGCAVVALLTAWHLFNIQGGFYGTKASPLWIIIPTVQGLVLGAVIVGYEHMSHQLPGLADRALAKVGEVSYSIYLLHFMFYPAIAQHLAGAGFDMTSLPVALSFATLTFPFIVAVAALSYRFIEQPFLQLRSNYDRRTKPSGTAITSAA